MYHDHLSVWWEAGAQQYLADCGFARDQQVRVWGETNVDYARYHECLVGNRPEMMPLNFHLFNGWHMASHDNIIKSSHLPPGPTDNPCKHGRYSAGTPVALSETLMVHMAVSPRAMAHRRRCDALANHH